MTKSPSKIQITWYISLISLWPFQRIWASIMTLKSKEKLLLKWLLQGVPPKGWQLRTKFWKLKNHIWQKVSPVLKSLNKNLSDGTLKPGKIKLEVFLNSKSKKNVKSEKWFCTLPPQLIMPPAPLPPGKKNFFARGRWCRRHYKGVGVKKVRRG